MGVWGARAVNQSSNWLRTVLATLEHEAAREVNRVCPKTMFLLTYNLVSYYILRSGSSTSPMLHQLIMQVKALEAQLGCFLEVGHVPGTCMITQGTDGLSRGLWLTPERMPTNLHQILFLPVPYSVPLGRWALE